MRTFTPVVLIAAAAGLVGVAGQARAELVFATTLTGTLISFDSATPGTLLSGVAIQGLQANEVVQGIDFRPSTGELYAVGSFSRLYRLNSTTGQATFVASMGTALNGANFGVDFNPVVDRIRSVSDVDQNLRINPLDGSTIVDGSLAFVAGDPNAAFNANVSYAAYTNSFAGATSTTLYVIDAGRDVLAIQNPPNSGTLTTVGNLGSDIAEMGGFDISGATGIAYVVISGLSENRSTFGTINLATGMMAPVANVGGGIMITSMAVIPTPGSIAVLGLGGLAFARRRRS